jgi:hypothetical protein
MISYTNNYFEEEILQTLTFPSTQAAYEELNHLALLSGFELASKYSYTIPYAYFYCRKGGRIKSGRPTAKTSCPFFIRLSVVNRYHSKGDIKIVEYNLNHNGHDLNPSDFAHKTLPDETREIISQLYGSGATASTIRKFLVERGFPMLTTIQISRAAHQKDIENFALQTDELVDSINSSNGFSQIYEEIFDSKIQRLAVITVTQNQLENLNQYGDVMFIDSTITPTDLQWQIIPITLVDQYKNLICGGILFSAIINTEVVKWMLGYLLSISTLQYTLETIISDDDQSFKPAIEDIFENQFQHRREQMHHVLCANHKN